MPPRKPAPARRRLVTLTEAAEHANISPRTLRRYVAAGRLPAFRVGPRMVRVDLDDLDAIVCPIPTGGDAA